MANTQRNRRQFVIREIQINEVRETRKEVLRESHQVIATELERRDERRIVVEVGDGKLRVGQVALATGEVARTEERLRVVKQGEVGRQTSAGEVPTDHVLDGLRGKYETNVSRKLFYN